MNDDLHVSGAVSVIVMFAAIASTFNVYSLYKDDQVATKYEEVQISLDNTASVLLSLKMEKAAMTAVATTSTTTTKTKTSH